MHNLIDRKYLRKIRQKRKNTRNSKMAGLSNDNETNQLTPPTQNV